MTLKVLDTFAHENEAGSGRMYWILQGLVKLYLVTSHIPNSHLVNFSSEVVIGKRSFRCADAQWLIVHCLLKCARSFDTKLAVYVKSECLAVAHGRNS